MSVLTRSTLRDLGQRVAEAGVDVDPQALTELAATAQAAGVSPVAIEVLLDEAAPGNVRLRAFERITCALSRVIYSPTRANVAIAA
jgi:hypothetical protein